MGNIRTYAQYAHMHNKLSEACIAYFKFIYNEIWVVFYQCKKVFSSVSLKIVHPQVIKCSSMWQRVDGFTAWASRPGTAQGRWWWVRKLGLKLTPQHGSRRRKKAESSPVARSDSKWILNRENTLFLRPKFYGQKTKSSENFIIV